MGAFEKRRELTIAEWDLGWEVFWDTIPYERVFIGDKFGFGGRAWMECIAPGFFMDNIYILHLGELGFQDATSDARIYGPEFKKQVKHTFIHELTHVWQSHKKKQWVFTRSVFSQACEVLAGNEYSKAYEYKSDLKWNDYNVEQQASIVEDWFKAGMTTDSELYKYIRDHIRNC